jgi:uncharacterized Fe-S cluster-containing radical SAM superfamily enzyme
LGEKQKGVESAFDRVDVICAAVVVRGYIKMEKVHYLRFLFCSWTTKT